MHKIQCIYPVWLNFNWIELNLSQTKATIKNSACYEELRWDFVKWNPMICGMIIELENELRWLNKWLINENKYNHSPRTPDPSTHPVPRVHVLCDIAIYLAYWQWSQFSAKCNLNYLFLLTRSCISTADTQYCHWDMIHKCRLQITKPMEKLNWVENYLNCNLFLSSTATFAELQFHLF